MALSRRSAMAVMAAAGTAAAAQAPRQPEIPGPVTDRHDAYVKDLLARQVIDPASRWCGSFPDDDGLHSPHSAAAILDAFTAAFLHAGSKFHQSALLLERLSLAGRHLAARQHENGTIDLLTTNFNSPPDTAFVVHNVGTAARLARRHGLAQVAALTEPFLRKAGGALLRGGVHTPNHRWVVGYALAQIHELFPDPEYVRRIDQWLAEGVDSDADGQFAERSTLVYNAISDRALVVMAAKLNRPELLDPVRRNLEGMLWLLHPGYEVVTEISRRQDVNQRGTMASYWFPLKYLAVKDGDGKFAALAREFEAQAAGLSAMMEYPETTQPGPPPAPIPEDYERHFPALGIARVRRGLTSATMILGGSSRFFTLRRGAAVVNAVRFASAFFGKGQFVPATASKRADAYVFEQTLRGEYYQPFDPPRRIGGQEYDATRGERKRSEVCTLRQTATVTESRNGFRLRVEVEGTADVPVAVEINLREGGTLEGCAPHPKVADAWLLSSGSALFRAGNDTIRFGPGSAPHRYVLVRGAEPKLPGPSVYLTGYSPFDREIVFELG
jgi:hypothetical protein